jgi:hypothetical protein
MPTKKHASKRTRGTSRTDAPVMPTTKAKTAYGLLGDIAKIITAEPLRYNQQDTLSLRSVPAHADLYVQFPACGTVGCVAGWVVALTHSEDVQWHIERQGRTLTRAAEVLGLNGAQHASLFYAGAVPYKVPVQTLEHAKAGAKHIDRFRREHRAQLLKTPIQIGGRS